jgi:uncharacterized protein YjiS (DUF1127 family)
MYSSVDSYSFSPSVDDQSSRSIGVLFRLPTALQRFVSSFADWRRQARTLRKYQSVLGLDEQVLEEIGLSRCQVGYDTSEPVWWR